MKLSHTTKVTIRRALKALSSLDKAECAQQDLLRSHGYQIVDLKPKAELSTLIAIKAGFRNRDELEAFAIKHRLLNIEIDYGDNGVNWDAPRVLHNR